LQMEFQELRKILVVRNDRLGEFLLIIPALRAIKETFNSAELSLVINSSVKELAEKIQYAHDLIIWENKRHSLKEILGFSRLLKQKKYDACLILNPSKEFNLISFLTGIPTRVGYDRKWGFLLTDKIKDTKHFGDRHEVDCNLELVGFIGAKTTDNSLSIKLEGKTLPELMGRLNVAIHPFVSDPIKLWPVERFKQLAKRISSELGLRVLIIGKDQGDSIGKGRAEFENLDTNIVNMINKTSLIELAQILKECKLLISCDSGPVHLSCAVGTPVLALFRNDLPGKTAKRWGPYSPDSKVLEKNSLVDITVDDVFLKAKEMLSINSHDK